VRCIDTYAGLKKRDSVDFSFCCVYPLSLIGGERVGVRVYLKK
jgi:hypothetical protein